jgi:hypothetical protein
MRRSEKNSGQNNDSQKPSKISSFGFYCDRDFVVSGKIEQLKIQPAVQQNSNKNCEKHRVFLLFFSQFFAESGPKKGRDSKNSEEQFCPSFLKTPDKFFFLIWKNMLSLIRNSRFYKWFLRNRKKKTYQAFFGNRNLKFSRKFQFWPIVQRKFQKSSRAVARFSWARKQNVQNLLFSCFSAIFQKYLV